MPPKPLRLDGCLDIECAAWDRFVVGVCYRPSDSRTFTKIGDMVDFLTGRGGVWWTWNGGRYDTLAIAEVLRDRGVPVQCSMSGSSVTRMVAGSLTIVDAYALIPLSLATAAEMAGERAPRDLGWRCRCRENCGGYCQITSTMSAERKKRLAEYCENDARIAYAVIATVIGRFRELGIVGKSTLGGTAWETARAWAQLPAAEWRSSTWRFARSGYYGGRNIVARPFAASGDHYDVTSAYPAALASTALPIGEGVEAAGPRARKAFDRGIPGIYQARVLVPECYLPPLPTRDENGGILYTVGEVRGAWVLPELKAAVERGARILSIGECLAYPDGSDEIFRDVIGRWYALRAACPPGSAWNKFWRLFCNSVTGKLAEQPEREGVSLNPGRIKYCDPRAKHSKIAGCTAKFCTGKCGAYRQLDSDGRVWATPYYRIGEASHVHWAAYLTATTRLTWLRAAEEVGDHLVYGDTDSIWTQFRPPSNCGTGLGEWSHKNGFVDWECRAPKVYRYTDSSTGEAVVRVAGARGITDEQWRALDSHSRKIVSDRGVMTLREAAPGGRLFRRRRMRLRLPHPVGVYGDRVIDMSDGRTYPRTREQIEEIKKNVRIARKG